MNIFLTIIVIIFGLIGVTIVIYAYIPIVRKKRNKFQIGNEDVSNEIEKRLGLLRCEKDTEKLANAFIELMLLSYVLVHVIVNKGNNYKDKVQCKVFCDFLTPDVIDKVKLLEGNNGECTL